MVHFFEISHRNTRSVHLDSIPFEREAAGSRHLDKLFAGGDEQTLQQTYSPGGSARCVQNFDDSLDFAIRMTYRISLRSSSLWEPRHPLLKVFCRLDVGVIS
jgi:hypothetical protein